MSFLTVYEDYIDFIMELDSYQNTLAHTGRIRERILPEVGQFFKIGKAAFLKFLAALRAKQDVNKAASSLCALQQSDSAAAGGCVLGEEERGTSGWHFRMHHYLMVHNTTASNHALPSGKIVTLSNPGAQAKEPARKLEHEWTCKLGFDKPPAREINFIVRERRCRESGIEARARTPRARAAGARHRGARAVARAPRVGAAAGVHRGARTRRAQVLQALQALPAPGIEARAPSPASRASTSAGAESPASRRARASSECKDCFQCQGREK